MIVLFACFFWIGESEREREKERVGIIGEGEEKETDECSRTLEIKLTVRRTPRPNYTYYGQRIEAKADKCIRIKQKPIIRIQPAIELVGHFGRMQAKNPVTALRSQLAASPSALMQCIYPLAALRPLPPPWPAFPYRHDHRLHPEPTRHEKAVSIQCYPMHTAPHVCRYTHKQMVMMHVRT